MSVLEAMVMQTLFGFPVLAARWGVSTDMLKRAAARGELKTIRLAGRVMVPRSEVERVEAEGLGHGRKKPERKAE